MLEFLSAHKIVSAVGGVIVLLLVLAIAVSQTKKVSPLTWNWFGATNSQQGIAIAGYDPVAYHTDGRPTPGDAAHSTEWGGAEWRFASAENLALFSADPLRYAPHYGGFCAFAASKGFTAEGDPEIWHVEGGDLYLFADQGPRTTWVGEIDAGVIARTDENWSARTARYDRDEAAE